MWIHVEISADNTVLQSVMNIIAEHTHLGESGDFALRFGADKKLGSFTLACEEKKYKNSCVTMELYIATFRSVQGGIRVPPTLCPAKGRDKIGCRL